MSNEQRITDLEKSQAEIIKTMMGIFFIFQVLSPKIGPFLSKSEKAQLEEQLKILGKTIVRLSEE